MKLTILHIWALTAFFGVLLGQEEALQNEMTYTYYPNYNIVKGIQNNIFNLSYPVEKVSPENARGTIVGYVSYQENDMATKQDYALILNSAKGDAIGIDIMHHASGLLHGPGIPVATHMQKNP